MEDLALIEVILPYRLDITEVARFLINIYAILDLAQSVIAERDARISDLHSEAAAQSQRQ